MGPDISSPKSLPSLINYMRDTFGSDHGLHNHKKQQIGHPLIADSDRLSPAYQQPQPGAKPLAISMPRVPLPPNHMIVNNDVPMLNDIEGHSSLTIPSPVSPRTTRCPSLADSIFTQTTCYSPSRSGPTTPTSEHGGALHTYTIRHDTQNVSRLYENRDTHYTGRSLSPPPSQKTPHHGTIHSNTFQPGISSSRLAHSMDPDTLMMPKHHEEKITKQEKRRRNHLESEKRRRGNIKGGMDALVDLVPSCEGSRESKANILEKTRQYIWHLRHLSEKSQMEVKRLSQENKELRRRLALQTPPHHQSQPESLVYRARS